MASAPRTARAVARAELTRAILDRASVQLAKVGPAALSLRAVARDLEMASSAVYRYFESRDALLTALLVRAYDDLGEHVEAAAALEPDDPAARFRAAAHAIRDWARAHPHEYALLYGSPVPGYAAPVDTVPAAVRAPSVLMEAVSDAEHAGRRPRGALDVSDAESASVAPVSSFTGSPMSPVHTVRALGAWATLFGHVSLELFGHMHNAVLDYDVHFAAIVDQLVADLGLSSRTAGGTAAD